MNTRYLNTFICVVVTLTSSFALMSQNNTNPLLVEKFGTPFETAPYDKIKPEYFLPAVQEAIKQGRAEIDAIANNPAKPTFANTIEAMEKSGRLLSRTTSVFFNLNSVETTPELQKVARDISPLMSDYGNDITLNEKLFKRVKAVWDSRNSLKLTPEQAKLLDDTYKGFSRNGANLSDADKEKLRAIDKELAETGLKFNENVLAETNNFHLVVDNPADLGEMPDNIKESAAAIAKSKGLDGKWIFTLQQPSYLPFMTYCPNRDLRQKMYIAYNSRCAKDNEFDNRPVAIQIAMLRYQKAALLGYKNYAEYALENRMAKNTQNVNDFLGKLLEKSAPYGKNDVQAVQEYMNANGADFQLQPWDWSFYSEKLKAEKYSVNEEELRPYFALDNVVKGIFTLANKLYGVSFKERHDIAVWHQDVKVYEVFDNDGKHLALFYADYFPRAGKRPGAWMNSLSPQYMENGVDVRPIVVNVCNFTPPSSDKPSLLSPMEVTTAFHEFGHALHGMLAKTKYSELSGTSVPRDFVELPSQVLENWAFEKEMLALYANHYETNEPIPADLVEKLNKSKLYNQGYATMRQLSLGMLDMAWYTQDFSGVNTVEEASQKVGGFTSFERKAVADAAVLPTVDGTAIGTTFGHIFGGGYAAGYYSYKWAEVLDADAFSLFKAKGLFDKATAQSFRDNILSKGGSEDPMILYKRFRGQEPSLDALLKKSGFAGR